ncbi:MAG: hypothetical protein HYY43_05280 [Deltaproteobacteria bacterium]|nr:hypothetical protein [Deltaproteobacteria bacterium]
MLLKVRLICGSILIILAISLDSAHASYRSTLHDWTRSGKGYAFETLGAKLIWNATMLSAEILNAQNDILIKKGLRPYSNGVEQKKITGLRFFVSLYTPKELKDFSLEENSTWKLLLHNNGSEIQPTKIEQVTITPTEKYFYPYLNRWSRAYLIEFPITEADLGRNPELVLRSIVAESRLKWKVSRSLRYDQD